MPPKFEQAIFEYVDVKAWCCKNTANIENLEATEKRNYTVRKDTIWRRQFGQQAVGQCDSGDHRGVFVKLAILTAVAALIATPAVAQDAQNFSGFFVGGQTGWQQQQINIDQGNTKADAKADGLMYGAQAGYDYRIGSFVIGAEAMISGSSGSIEANLPTTLPAPATPISSYKINAGTTFGGSVRAGYVVAEPVLLYGRVGYTFASYNLVYNNTIERSYDRDGINVGLGAEYQFSSNISARIEWNYGDYGSDTFQRPAAAPIVFLPTKFNFERQGVAFGLNFRF